MSEERLLDTTNDLFEAAQDLDFRALGKAIAAFEEAVREDERHRIIANDSAGKE
jgi:cytochrome c peroxidase